MMMKMPHRVIWGQLSRHSSKFGVQQILHQSTAVQSQTDPSQPPVPPSQGKAFKEIQIPVPWGHISGKWWGSMSVQPLVGLHGWQDNAGTWDRFAPLLPPDVSLLSLDLPGHGRSSHFHPGRCYHLLEYVSFVRRVVLHYGWERVSLLAHSLGSITAFVYACVYPETVAKYVAVDAMKPLSYDPAKDVRKNGRNIDAFIAASRLDPTAAPTYTYAEATERLVAASRGSLTADVAHHLLERGLAGTADAQYRYTRDPRLKVPQLTNWTHETVLELASNIRCEVCVVNGNPGLSYDEPRKHRDVYDAVARVAKRFEVHVVEGTHHFHLTAPEVLLPIVVDFLNK